MIAKVIYKNLDALRKYSKTFNTFLEGFNDSVEIY